MLNRLDDYPIHQTPEPIAVPATSDRNVYDRTWFNGYSADGSQYFGIGMAVYPHRQILDGAFSAVELGGRQHAFYGSRRAPDERTDMSVGPFRIEVVEPLRRTRVILDDNDSGLACDVTFSSRTAPIEEARQTLWIGTKRWMDATRFDQFGRWTGTVQHPDGEFDVGMLMERHQGPLVGCPPCRRARGRWCSAAPRRRLLPLGPVDLGRPRVPRDLLRRAER